jgi:hypothetical protein
MVFKEERRISWLLPLSRSLSVEKQQQTAMSPGVAGCCRCDADRGFEIADAMEMGYARELVTDFVLPLRKSSRLWKFHVKRYSDHLQYRLSDDDGSFLMYARASADGRVVEFYLYDPNDGNELYDPGRPAFTMTRNALQTQWSVVQELPAVLPARASRLEQQPRREVATISHAQKNVGGGVNHYMEARLHPDSRDPSQDIELQTRLPTWNKDVESLVLDFKGRKILASAKNFQMSLTKRPNHVALQYAKIGANSFGLDFRFPLTVIQAFAISLTTVTWL